MSCQDWFLNVFVLLLSSSSLSSSNDDDFTHTHTHTHKRFRRRVLDDDRMLLLFLLFLMIVVLVIIVVVLLLLLFFASRNGDGFDIKIKKVAISFLRLLLLFQYESVRKTDENALAEIHAAHVTIKHLVTKWRERERVSRDDRKRKASAS